VPIALGAGMLGTVVAAGLAPSIGAVAAQTNCQYSDCSAATTSPFPWWIVALVVAIVVVAALLALMLFRRRPPANPPAPEAWEPPEGASASSPTGPSPPSAAPVDAAALGGAAVAGAAVAGAAAPASYVEGPEDVGQAMPVVAAAPAAADEPDIDSLMAELDKISGEILNKAPKPGAGQTAATEGEDAADL
jgi:hypothetical protein